MSQKNYLTLDDEFIRYCELNKITDTEKFAKKVFGAGFNITKYGESPPGFNSKERIIEKEIIKEVPVETIVEKVVEVIKEVPIEKVVEVIKEVPVEKVVYITNEEETEQKIFQQKQEFEEEKRKFSTKRLLN